MKTARFSGLYAVTPDWEDTEQLVKAVRASLEGGARLVQYRTKSNDIALQHEQASELLGLCREFDVPLLVNDNLRLAALIDADGIHIGAGDVTLREARIVLGPARIIGVSCYNKLHFAVEAEKGGADYVAFGSFFASPTKPHAIPAPLTLLREAKQQLHLPVIAIGGITLENAATLVEAGADAIAVISGLFECDDIRAAAFAFDGLFSQHNKFKTLH